MPGAKAVHGSLVVSLDSDKIGFSRSLVKFGDFYNAISFCLILQSDFAVAAACVYVCAFVCVRV